MKNILKSGINPPQAIEEETAIIGALILEPDSMDRAQTVLKGEAAAEVFYKDSHRVIYSALAEMHSKRMKIDILTLINHLKSQGKLEIAGGYQYIAIELTSKVASAANIEAHCRIVYEKFAKRQLIATGQKLMSSGYDETVHPLEATEDAHKELNAISDPVIVVRSRSLSDMALGTIAAIEDRMRKAKELGFGKILGVPTGNRPLDFITGGDEGGDLVIAGGRSGMGKTAFALAAVLNAAREGLPQQIFSLEMKSQQLVLRFISMISGVSFRKIKLAQLSEQEFKRVMSAIGEFEKLPIYIEYCPGLSISEFASKVRRYKSDYGIARAVADYAQLMVQRRDQIRTEMIEISGRSKEIAGALDIPIWQLSQLSRSIDNRASKRPYASDLSESGSLENDADLIYLIYRPAHYLPKDKEYHKKTYPELTSEEFNQLTLLIIEKSRNGIVCDVPMTFRGSRVLMKECLDLTIWDRMGILTQDIKDYIEQVNPDQFELPGVRESEVLEDNDLPNDYPF